ncbi:uncharacterized protein LOC104420717 isoform X2 [Eucalyptus grandis]|uniref:uncharacterized protein LOC104420717 isoform X2 n=1 Tax=Eucalyptus grandis TaxID=71139 RepID=UPI00192F0D48|nr:uncharacterized protein LOC104420717 isoform X2 [Eucalyptus grandis]
MEAGLCSGSSSVVDEKRKRKREESNRNVSNFGMDRQNYFPEKNSSVNVIISLPSLADSSSALVNVIISLPSPADSKAQPCNELNPLPANRKKKKKKKKRKIQEASTTQGDTGAEVPCSVLQANELDVKYNITCSSGNSHQRLEHEKIRPTGEANCLTKRQMKKKEKRKLQKRRKKEAKAKEKVSGKSDTLTKIPNDVSQIAELDENILKEFSSTCVKQSDIEKNLCSLEKKDVHGEAHTLLSDFSSMSTSSKKKSVKKLKTDQRKKPSSRLTTGIVDISEDLVHKETSFHSDEARVSRLLDSKPEQVEERKQVTLAQASIKTSKAEASVDSGRVSLCENSNGNGGKVNRQIDEGNPSSELLVSEGDIKSDININKGSMPWQILDILSERTSIGPSRKKLLILDLNGLLADIIPYVGLGCKPDLIVSRKAVFKRPFVDDFVQFCFEKFAVGVWSSRTKRNVDPVVDFLMGDSKGKLLFCWDQSHCTITKFSTVEKRDKPLVLKELRKLWDKLEPNLPWEKGAYDESNTLLLDDSPYKALRNPANTGIFPYSYHHREAKDNSLGPGGDLRVYLESLALADNVRKYVEQNPFGQRAVTNSNPSWKYYKRVLASDPPEDATSISNHASVDGIGVGSVGSRQTTSSPKSATWMDWALPHIGGDRYDPLFDSIEPFSSSVKKVDCAHKGESVDDSDVILRNNDSNTPVDVEENNKRKEIRAFASSISVDDDGFGETAGVEVGAVEYWSISNFIDAADATEVEMEIDQIKSIGKSKKHKDYRSMKLFKIALANFVKEVLRPSWRRGNMSKEAYKTILKKTVDKVTGAMKSHHMPKSQAEINHYIDSSQRKLTKLVMGYLMPPCWCFCRDMLISMSTCRYETDGFQGLIYLSYQRFG